MTIRSLRQSVNIFRNISQSSGQEIPIYINELLRQVQNGSVQVAANTLAMAGFRNDLTILQTGLNSLYETVLGVSGTVKTNNETIYNQTQSLSLALDEIYDTYIKSVYVIETLTQAILISRNDITVLSESAGIAAREVLALETNIVSTTATGFPDSDMSQL